MTVRSERGSGGGADVRVRPARGRRSESLLPGMYTKEVRSW